MIESAFTPCRTPHRAPPSTSPEILAEQHLMHRIVVATAIAVPLGGIVVAALVTLGTALGGQSPWISTLMGAAVGVLGGLFFGVWAGFVASIDEFDAADLQALPDPEH